MTTFQAVLFDLVGNATSPVFKSLMGIIKDEPKERLDTFHQSRLWKRTESNHILNRNNSLNNKQTMLYLTSVPNIFLKYNNI